jgi:tetratricopeptide (TPR) repeat protein
MAARKKPSTPLAWVGSITAVFSLIGGVYAGWVFLSGQLEKRRTIHRLLAEEAVQLGTSDYESAWKTLDQAAKGDPDSTRVRDAREDLAMDWLDNIGILREQTFSEIVDKLEPVLTAGAASAKSPQRQADLLAHLGWSYFLRSREATSSPDPATAYRDALERDSGNPYAHAMWGHWLLWNHKNFADALAHFTAALASPRPGMHAYVRKMQLSALNNAETPEAHDELIRVANEIRKEHGEMDPDRSHDVLNLYWEYVTLTDEHSAAFLRAVPAAEHLATFEWLVRQEDPSGSEKPDHAYIHAALLEAAGRREEALAGYRALQSRFKDSRGTLPDNTRKAIARLTGAR